MAKLSVCLKLKKSAFQPIKFSQKVTYCFILAFSQGLACQPMRQNSSNSSRLQFWVRLRQPNFYWGEETPTQCYKTSRSRIHCMVILFNRDFVGKTVFQQTGIRTQDLSTRIICLCFMVHLVVFIKEVLYLKPQNEHRQTENETEMTSMFFSRLRFRPYLEVGRTDFKVKNPDWNRPMIKNKPSTPRADAML